MITVDLTTVELTEFIAKGNPSQRCRATFPMFSAQGTQECASVYFEIDPAEHLGTHTDSAEEILLILEGTVEATVGHEKAIASKGQLILIPKMVPHNIHNVGTQKAKVLGFFGANNIVAIFENTWWPNESNTVDTALMAQG